MLVLRARLNAQIVCAHMFDTYTIICVPKLCWPRPLIGLGLSLRLALCEACRRLGAAHLVALIARCKNEGVCSSVLVSCANAPKP